MFRANAKMYVTIRYFDASIFRTPCLSNPRSKYNIKKQQGWASVLFKRTQRSCVLCVLFCALEKNGKERNILLGFISRQKLKKERKRMLCSLKERKRTERSEGKRTRCPTHWIAKGKNVTMLSEVFGTLHGLATHSLFLKFFVPAQLFFYFIYTALYMYRWALLPLNFLLEDSLVWVAPTLGIEPRTITCPLPFESWIILIYLPLKDKR